MSTTPPVCVDNATRLAYVEVLDDERAVTAVGFLRRATAFFVEERDESNRRMEQLRTGIAEGTLDSIPDVVRQAVLDRIKDLGFSRRCPCLYDADHGCRGYESHSLAGDDDEDVDDYDERNSVDGCELCAGSGSYDPVGDENSDTGPDQHFRPLVPHGGSDPGAVMPQSRIR